LSDQTFEEIQNQVRTNLEGLIKMTRECLPYVRDVVINLSSGAGLEGFADLTTYCATKFGVRGFSQALSEELSDVKVYTMYPPVTATRMNNFRGTPPDAVAQVIVNIAKDKCKARSGSDVKFWEVAL
jgi:3-oxoacyl-[acyl-carrier protein] reductase